MMKVLIAMALAMVISVAASIVGILWPDCGLAAMYLAGWLGAMACCAIIGT